MTNNYASLPFGSAEFYQSLPKKRMASGVLLLNDAGHILLVKPHYKEQWIIPGGITEENESPQLTALRETVEETGLDVKIGRLLWSGEFKPQDDEIVEIKFWPIDEAAKLVTPGLSKHLVSA